MEAKLENSNLCLQLCELAESELEKADRAHPKDHLLLAAAHKAIDQIKIDYQTQASGNITTTFCCVQKLHGIVGAVPKEEATPILQLIDQLWNSSLSDVPEDEMESFIQDGILLNSSIFNPSIGKEVPTWFYLANESKIVISNLVDQMDQIQDPTATIEGQNLADLCLLKGWGGYHGLCQLLAKGLFPTCLQKEQAQASYIIFAAYLTRYDLDEPVNQQALLNLLKGKWIPPCTNLDSASFL